MSVLAGPLTTVFTPPPSCTATTTSGAYFTGVSLFVGHLEDYAHAGTACYPHSTRSFNFFEEYYYSPGVCPYGLTTACDYTAKPWPRSVTAKLCCPTGFTCREGGWPHVCSKLAPRTITNLFILTASDVQPGSSPSLTSSLATGSGFYGDGVYIYNDGVPVLWESTDTEILQILGSTAKSSQSKPSPTSPTSLTSATITTPPTSILSQSSSTPMSTSSPPPSAGGINKTAIAVSVPFAIVALATGGLCLFLYLRRLDRRRSHKQEVDGKPISIHEAPSDNERKELMGSAVPHELPTPAVELDSIGYQTVVNGWDRPKAG